MEKNIVEVARDAGTFTTLVEAIDRAGLEPTLSDDGPYTVFAPGDDAFADLPNGTVDTLLTMPEMLSEILTYHVVPGRMTTAEVLWRASAPTMQGEDLPVWLALDGRVRVHTAKVLDPDIEASNGLIHVIDRVLLPANI